MKEIFQQLNELLERQQAAVLVTVISSVGSTPRGKGAHMLVTDEGRAAGTIGGGAVEFRAEELAKDVLKTQKASKEKFILAPNDIADLGMVCGGNVEVSFHYFASNDPQIEQVCRKINHCYAENQQGWLLLATTATNGNGIGFYSPKTGLLGNLGVDVATIDFQESTAQVISDQCSYWIEPLLKGGNVYVFGSGHVAQAVVPVLEKLDFYCVVVDDRPQLLTADYFPDADQRVLADLTHIEKSVQLKATDYAVVMTRSHKFDFEVTRQLLRKPPEYIGVMGSQRKIDLQIKRLKESGFVQAEIQRINMPIGLNIKAETPAELAISVAGELIMKRAAKR